MNFERLLLKAKEGNADAVLKILEIYKPLLIAYEALSSVFHLTSYSILDISPVPPAIKAAPSFGSPTNEQKNIYRIKDTKSLYSISDTVCPWKTT